MSFVKRTNDNQLFTKTNMNFTRKILKVSKIRLKEPPPSDKVRYCWVPGCSSKTIGPQLLHLFYKLPGDPKRRLLWLKALHCTRLPHNILENLSVCYEHFVKGAPSEDERDVDWVPNRHVPATALRDNEFIENIIKSLPEVAQQFDSPDYVFVQNKQFDEKYIENQLIHKYIMNPNWHNEDHNYAGLPPLPKRPKKSLEDHGDHNYSMKLRPACEQFDSRNFCNLCSRNFANMFTFNKHMVKHTVKNDVTCGICDRTFLTTNCLNMHLNQHTDLCEECGNEVPKMQLERHQLENKKQKDKLPETHLYKVLDKHKTYFCVYCMKEFSNGNFWEHLWLHRKKV